MSIAEVESMDGIEGQRWENHFATHPFLIDFLDLVQAHICQAVREAMSGKPHRLDKLLLLNRKKIKRRAKGEKTYFSEAD